MDDNIHGTEAPKVSANQNKSGSSSNGGKGGRVFHEFKNQPVKNSTIDIVGGDKTTYSGSEEKLIAPSDSGVSEVEVKTTNTKLTNVQWTTCGGNKTNYKKGAVPQHGIDKRGNKSQKKNVSSTFEGGSIEGGTFTRRMDYNQEKSQGHSGGTAKEDVLRAKTVLQDNHISNATVNANAGDKNVFAGRHDAAAPGARRQGAYVSRAVENEFTGGSLDDVTFHGNAGNVNVFEAGSQSASNRNPQAGGTRSVMTTLTGVKISGGEYNFNAGDANLYK